MEKMIKTALKSATLVVMNLVVIFLLSACSTMEEPEMPVPAQQPTETEQETETSPEASESDAQTPTGEILGIEYFGRYISEGPIEGKLEKFLLPVAYELRETVRTDTGSFVKYHHLDLRIRVSAPNTGVFAKDSVFMYDYCGLNWQTDKYEEKVKDGFTIKTYHDKLHLSNFAAHAGWTLEFFEQTVSYEMPVKFVSEYGYQFSILPYEIVPETSSFEVEKSGEKNFMAKSVTHYAVKHLSPEIQSFDIPQYVELMFTD